MKILFVSTHTNPLAPPFNGDSQRTRLLLQACARIGEVDVVTFAGKAEADLANVHVVHDSPVGTTPARTTRIGKWRTALCAESLQDIFPVEHEREQIVDRIVQAGDYDCIVSRYIYRTLPCGLWKYRQQLVVDFDDALPFHFHNQLAPDASAAARLRTDILSRQAGRLTPRTVKELKAAFFAERNVAAANHATHLPNIPYYQGACDDPDYSTAYRRLLFVGQLDYKPNREGISHFLEHIYMPLHQQMPNVEFHIVGRQPDKATCERWQSYPDVTLTGFADDLQSEYNRCHIVVAPIYSCGGTNIKLLEAMQMNRACITTAAAFDHLRPAFENRRDLVAAASDSEYTEALAHLLTHPEESRTLARNGRAKALQHHSFDTFATIVANTIACR